MFTKSSMLTDLSSKAAQSRGTFLHLAGDCCAALVGSQGRLAVALKESTMGQKLWVGCPAPMLDLLLGRYSLVGGDRINVHLTRIFIALAHLPKKTVLLIPLGDVYSAVVDKAKSMRTDIDGLSTFISWDGAST
jgi:hypothetical protein